MSESELKPLSDEELAAEEGTALPDKEVISLLDLNADLDLGLVDRAVLGSTGHGLAGDALADQGVIIDQGITGEAVASGTQDSTIDQAEGGTGTGTDAGAGTDAGTGTDGGTGVEAGTGTTPTDALDPSDAGSVLDGDLLDVDVDVAADLDLAAPIAGAVAANANVAAPIDAAVAANVASLDSDATAIAQQDAIITQDIDADAEATTDQSSDIQQ